MGYIYKFDDHSKKFQRLEVDFRAPLKEGQVRIKPFYVGICGSDINQLIHNNPTPPIGHEWVGEVIESTSKSFKVGDSVTSVAHISCEVCDVCQSGNHHLCRRRKLLGGKDAPSILSSETILRETDLIHLPGSKDSLQRKSLLEVAFIGDCAFNKAKLIGLQKEDNVLVFGAGPVGLFTALSFKERGHKVKVIDIVPERLKFATDAKIESSLFAEQLLNPDEFSSYDVIIDCSGDSYGNGAIAVIAKFAKIDGKVVVVGKYKSSKINEKDFANKSLTAAWVANHRHEDFLKSIDFWSTRLAQVPASWQSLYSIEEINQAFEAAKSREHLKCTIVLNEGV